MTIDEFFAGYDHSRKLFDRLHQLVLTIGPADLRISKSQVAFCRKKAFAWAWIPGKYLKGNIAPLVLTFSFVTRDRSPRWKEIVEPYPGRFTHHLELHTLDDLDSEVRGWLQAAWEAADN